MPTFSTNSIVHIVVQAASNIKIDQTLALQLQYQEYCFRHTPIFL